MKRRDYHAFIADIRRLRPAIVIVLAILVLLPSFYEVVAQELSALVVLKRMAETVAVLGALVWIASNVMISYARVQARTEHGPDQEGDIRA